MDLTKRKVRELIDLLEKGETSCSEIVEACLKVIERHDGALGAFISTVERESLLKQAEQSDTRRRAGKAKSILDGLPIAIKDNIHAQTLPTTCGSRILAGYCPPFDATVVRKLKEKGLIIVGKTNLDEFAMGVSTETSAWKVTRNPWDSSRTPGGSSGGSAAAIAAGMVPLALGSDTGGSIRQPAGFCGIAGFKPTYGLVSRFGLVSYASSLDQIGPMARDVYGCTLLLEAIAGFDRKDSTSLNRKQKKFSLEKKSLKGKKIAIFPELYQEGVDERVRTVFTKSLEMLKDRGAKIIELSFPGLKYVISTYYFIATAEASSNLARFDGVKYGFRSREQSDYQEMLFTTRGKGLGQEVKKRIMLGNFVLSSGYYDAYYRKAQKTRAYLREQLNKVLEQSEMIATPTTPDVAFPFGLTKQDPLKGYLSDVTTALANLGGLPAISVPSGLADGLPVGLQLIGKALNEQQILQAGYQFEQCLKQDFIPNLDHLAGVEKSMIEAEHDHEQCIQHLYNTREIAQITASYKQRLPKKMRIFCRDLAGYIGKNVTICGWVHRIKKLGGVEFVILRDKTGMAQLVSEQSFGKKICLETVIRVTGIVTEESRSPFDNIELKAEKLEILAQADDQLPIVLNGTLETLNLSTVLDWRTISLRNPHILKTFHIQADIVRLFGELLRKEGFTEIKSPKIISTGTEGGTNIFEVKYFDRMAYLAQSPQFYKQIMVGSGLEKVYEIGPVFRAEHHDTVRHLNEYTSLDLELGFIENEQEIIDVQERLLFAMFEQLREKYGSEGLNLETPDAIPRIHFLQALEILADLGVKDIEEGDLSPEGEKQLCRYFEQKYNSSFVYIIGYPAKKRPMYTMPDERLPGYTRSFDLLFKGIEITTGGQRINQYEMLRNNIKKFGCDPGDFQDYLCPFKYGMPSHGGLGMGLERLTMKIMGYENIRSASLFPRDINRVTP